MLYCQHLDSRVGLCLICRLNFTPCLCIKNHFFPSSLSQSCSTGSTHFPSFFLLACGHLSDHIVSLWLASHQIFMCTHAVSQLVVFSVVLYSLKLVAFSVIAISPGKEKLDGESDQLNRTCTVVLNGQFQWILDKMGILFNIHDLLSWCFLVLNVHICLGGHCNLTYTWDAWTCFFLIIIDLLLVWLIFSYSSANVFLHV